MSCTCWNFVQVITCNHKASDLGYYASYDLIYLQKCDFTLKTLFPVQNKENDAMADHRRRHQITTRNSKITYYME